MTNSRVDGTLIESWASLQKAGDGKTPPNAPGNRTLDLHGERRSNATPESKTAPAAKFARKGEGKEAKLSYSAHTLIILDMRVDLADGRAERRNAFEMLDDNVPGSRSITLRADNGYDTKDFVVTAVHAMSHRT